MPSRRQDGPQRATDPDGRRIWFQGSLYDETDDLIHFNNTQQSRDTPDEEFTLGFGAGDYANILSGSLTGTLVASHDYHFSYNAFLQAFPDTPSGASATGFISLSFTPVPKPNTALLLSFGLAGMTMKRKRLS